MKKKFADQATDVPGAPPHADDSDRTTGSVLEQGSEDPPARNPMHWDAAINDNGELVWLFPKAVSTGQCRPAEAPGLLDMPPTAIEDLPSSRSIKHEGVVADRADSNANAPPAEAALTKDVVRFLRKDTAGRPAIVLVGAADARLPMAETHWSMIFAESYQRDRLYIWLLAQSDRWRDWLHIARTQRPGALTEHLLALFVAQDCEERGI